MRTPAQLPDRPDPPAAPVRSVAFPAAGLSQAPLSSADLLKGQKSVAIEHDGLIYRLQLTKLGKLILTK